MDRSRSRLAPVAVLIAVCSVPAARADRWETVRKQTIDPINSELHRHLPSYLKSRSLDQILSLYATDMGSGIPWEGAEPVYPRHEEEMRRWQPIDSSEPLRERYQQLLDLFPTIEKAELRIHRIHWQDADSQGIPADVRLIVRGVRADGAAAQLDQRMRLRIAERTDGWRITGESVVARELVARRRPRFAVATEEAGIVDVHANLRSPSFRIIGGTTASAGSAVADVDGDGCEDVFLPGDPVAMLYRNRCDGTFADVTEAWGIPRPFPAVAVGAVFFDYDNDGRPDLLVTAVAGGTRLYRNVDSAKGPRFVDVSDAARLPEARWASMAAVADYDHDGFLDIYIVRMGDHENTTPRPNYQADNGLANFLLHNDGDGTFRDVTKHAGVGDTGWGLAGAWGDYDGDGWPDLYVANEYGFSVLYHNRKNGRFEDVSEESGAMIRTAGMGVAWGDYDEDGDLDLYVSAMYANSRWALFHPDFPAPVPWYFRVLGLFTSEVARRSEQVIEDLTRGSTLLRNEGDGTFSDVSEQAGVRDGQWGWGAEFVDYDNDGRLDIFAQNGFVTGELPDDV